MYKTILNVIEYKGFSCLPKERVQELFTNFIRKTRPYQLKLNPKIIEYTDTKVTFSLQKHYGKSSVSVHLLLKNRFDSFILADEIVSSLANKNKFTMVVENVEYIDEELIKPDFISIIIRVDSITRLIPNGMKEFLKNEKVYGVTNGRLFVMCEMSSLPDYIDRVCADLLEPNGFLYNRDYVIGFSGISYGRDYGRPLDWCEVPWLFSEATPYGNFVKFKKDKIHRLKSSKKGKIVRSCSIQNEL